VCCWCVVTEGTYGAAVTFVCGNQEKDTLSRFAEVCGMYIRQLPGKLFVASDVCTPEDRNDCIVMIAQ